MPAPGRERAVGLLCVALVIAIWSSFIPVSRLGPSGALAPADLVARAARPPERRDRPTIRRPRAA